MKNRIMVNLGKVNKNGKIVCRLEAHALKVQLCQLIKEISDGYKKPDNRLSMLLDFPEIEISDPLYPQVNMPKYFLVNLHDSNLAKKRSNHI